MKPKNLIDLNDLAVQITLQEGKKIQLPISQVKEVLKLTFVSMAEWSLWQLADVLKRYKKK
jgi:hypothetical protein